jgi:hypothetical protein
MRQGVTRFGGLLPVKLAVIGLAAIGACNQSRLLPLKRTFPVGIVRDVTTENQEHAIEVALASRHWAVVQKLPGRYVARLDERSYMLIVDVDYGPGGINVNYVDSAALMYTRERDGRELIHRRYLTWVKNLVDDIRSHLVAEPPVAPDSIPPPQPASVTNDRAPAPANAARAI